VISWKKGFDIAKIIGKIEVIKSLNSSGKVSFGDFDSFIKFDEYVSILCNMLEINPEIPEGEKKNILLKAIYTAAKIGTIDKTNLEEQLEPFIVTFLKKPVKKFVVYTSISLNRSSHLRNVKISDVIIRFDIMASDKFRNGAQKQLNSARLLLYSDPPKDYLPIRAYISSRSALAAFNNALDAIDLLRGIWNLALNLQTWRRSFGLREPINKIVLGPIHTIHQVSGKIASNIWWYDTDYVKPINPYDIVKNLPALYQFERKVRNSLRQLQYRDKIEWAFREYSRALDHRNWRAAFLALWSVLEVLTDSGGDNYKVTIRRASFIFKDTDLHREILNHLRESRNAFIHSNKNSDDIELYIYELKRYIEALLLFHIDNGRKFSNIQEVGEFLDLPIDLDKLSKRIRLSRLATRFRT
jgi:hypothetical protein